LMDAALTTAVRRTLIQGIAPRDSGSGLPREIIATAASWAIYGAVKEWFSTSAHPPAEEIIRPVVELILPMLESVTRFSKPGSLLGVHREPE
jgi:hypothetical protein